MPTTNPVPSTDPSDLLFNAGKLDEVVNGTANSFTDRLGVQRQTLAGLSAEFPNAAANAAAAAASAVDAADSAQTAQDEAAAATAQASAANASRVAAEAARDAAQLSAGVYATTAAGLAATTSGKYFSVPSASSIEYLILYLNSSGTAVEVKRYPAASAVTSALDKLGTAVTIVPRVAGARLVGTDLQTVIVIDGDISAPEISELRILSQTTMYAVATAAVLSSVVNIVIPGVAALPYSFYIELVTVNGVRKTYPLSTISATPVVNTDFSNYETGKQPEGWLLLTNKSESAWTVVADAAYTGGKYLKETTALSNNIDWLANLAASGCYDSDQYLRFQTNGSAEQNGLFARGSVSASGVLRGYSCAWNQTTQQLQISTRGSTVIPIVNAAFTLALNTLAWIRFQVIGENIRAKIWTGAKTDEPASWAVDLRNPHISEPGYVGVSAQRTSGSRIYDVYTAEAVYNVSPSSVSIPYDAAYGTFQALGGGIVGSDGGYLTVWRGANTHVTANDNGKVYAAQAKDKRAFKNRKQIFAIKARDVRDPCLTMMADRSILMPVFEYNTNDATDIKLALLKTDENFSSVDVLCSRLSVFTDWTAAAAPVVELATGRMMWPVYGRDVADSRDKSKILMSNDFGKTWTSIHEFALSGTNYQEPNLIELSDGRLLVLIRTGTVVYKSYGTTNDGGQTYTFSAPTVAYDGIGAPRLVQLANGKIITVYRANTNEDAAYRISADLGATWSAETIFTSLTSGSSFQYGQLDRLTSDTAVLFYWMKYGATESRGFVTHLSAP